MASNGNTLNVEITASVDGLKKGLVTAEKGVTSFGKSTDKVASKTNTMSKAVKGNAVPALTSFSQVIQDAPYGIQGVANNITQLTSQFGYLSKSSGGAMGALKGMLGVLAGPAGILLAVSVITSLWVAYEKEIKAAISGTDDATVSTERLNDALRAQVNLRKQLKDELNIATSIAVAKAKLEGKSEEEQYSVRKEYADARITVLKGQYADELKTYRAFATKNQIALRDGDEDLLEVKKQSLKSLSGLEKEIRDAEAKSLLDSLNEQVRIQEKKKTVIKQYGTEVKSILTSFNSELIPITTSFNDVMTDLVPIGGMKTMSDRTAQMILTLRDFNQQASDIIKGGIANTFADLGYVIGEALATGGNVLQAAGAALLGALGNILIQMGEMAITIGVGMLGIKAALATLNPAVAIAAGVALVALGSFFSSKSADIASGVGGSSGGDTDYSSSGSSGGNYGSSGGSSGGTYVFEIAGTKLVGVLKNTLDRNRALGGTNLAF